MTKCKIGVVSILNLDIVRRWLKSLGGDIGDLGPTDECDSSFVCLICMQ